MAKRRNTMEKRIRKQAKPSLSIYYLAKSNDFEETVEMQLGGKLSSLNQLI
jgi:hypothetical protein